MKQLGNWLDFNVKQFLEGKVVLLPAPEDIPENYVKDGYRYRIKGFILHDPNNDELNSNEPLTIKFKNKPVIPKNQVQFKAGQFELANPTGVVYGDYRNQLSLKADGFLNKSESK
ncbi:hypothetical protein [Weissella viridescens]|uniref:hypothetical protein n=1 Tax=Weissella viridescens TaxID=1629 RepID=UPI003AF27E2B